MQRADNDRRDEYVAAEIGITNTRRPDINARQNQCWKAFTRLESAPDPERIGRCKKNLEASRHFKVAIGPIANHIVVREPTGNVYRKATELQRSHMSPESPLIKSRVAKSNHFWAYEEAFVENVISVLGRRPVGLKCSRIFCFAGKN